MKRVRCIGLAVLLAVAVATLVSSPALAHRAQRMNMGPYELLNVGDEPQASGEARLRHVHGVPDMREVPPAYYTGELTVKCQGLTPGATYWTPVGAFQADRRGRGAATGEVQLYIDPWGWDPTLLVVDVVRAGACVVVLSAVIYL